MTNPEFCISFVKSDFYCTWISSQVLQSPSEVYTLRIDEHCVYQDQQAIIYKYSFFFLYVTILKHCLAIFYLVCSFQFLTVNGFLLCPMCIMFSEFFNPYLRKLEIRSSTPGSWVSIPSFVQFYKNLNSQYHETNQDYLSKRQTQ